MYHGPTKIKYGTGQWLGIKPTKADRDFVRALSVMGIGTRGICVRLGERLKLGKPMSMMTLYHHFRNDLIRKARGRIPDKQKLKRKVEANILVEMRKMIFDVKKRGDRARRK